MDSMVSAPGRGGELLVRASAGAGTPKNGKVLRKARCNQALGWTGRDCGDGLEE